MSLKSFISQKLVNFSAKLQGIKFETEISRAGIVELPMWKTDYPLPFSGNMKKNMASAQQLVPVWRCIQIISHLVAEIPLKLYKKMPDGTEQLAEHDIDKLLQTVNPFMGPYDLWGQTTAYLKLTGNSFWAFEKDFTEIWVLRPDRVKIIPSQKDFIAGYEYKNEATQRKVIYQPEEILHFKGLSLESFFYGDSPIEPGSRQLSLERSAIDYNYRYFENDATPSGILSAQHEIDAEELKRIQRVWETAYKGTKKAHRVAVLDKNLKYEKVADSLKDMNFGELRRFNKEEILMLLGVPPAIAGDLIHADYANIRHQDKLLYSYGVIPILRLNESTLNQILLLRFKGLENHFYRYDLSGIEALQDTLAEKATTASALVNGRIPLITINEARERILNLPKLKDERADELQFTPIPNFFGLSSNNPPSDKSLEIPVKVVNRVEELIEVEANGKNANEFIIKHKFESSPTTTADVKEKIPSYSLTMETKDDSGDILWKKFDEQLTRQEKLFEKDMQGFFKGQAQRVLEKFDDFYPEKTVTGRISRKQINPTTDEIIFNFTVENGKLKVTLQKRIERILQAAFEETALDFDLAIDFNLSNPAIQNFLALHESKVNIINQTTKDQLNELVNNAIREGNTTQELRDDIIDLFKRSEGTDIEPGRAMTIARTETGIAYNTGSFQAAKESGIIDRKWWLSARDNNVRDSHKEMERQTVNNPIPVDSLFANGLMYPLDPSGSPDEVINCRCSINFISIKE